MTMTSSGDSTLTGRLHDNYGDVRFWNGIVPIGQLDGGELDTIARQHGDFLATIEQETR